MAQEDHFYEIRILEFDQKYSNLKEALYQKASALVELIMQEYSDFKKYKSSDLAISSILCARALLGVANSQKSVVKLLSNFCFESWAKSEISENIQMLKSTNLLNLLENLIISKKAKFPDIELMQMKQSMALFHHLTTEYPSALSQASTQVEEGRSQKLSSGVSDCSKISPIAPEHEMKNNIFVLSEKIRQQEAEIQELRKSVSSVPPKKGVRSSFLGSKWS